MADVVFGTHALFSGDVRYRALQLVRDRRAAPLRRAQRQALIDKGACAHVAPDDRHADPAHARSRCYGDLDTSILDERPPGAAARTTR
jgi:ATP-dependent DNA helicase RecG